MRWISMLLCAVMLAAFAKGSASAEEAFAAGEAASAAAEAANAGDALLQQGLTIHEIDKEVERLKLEQTGVQLHIDENKTALAIQERTLNGKSDAVGRVLRTYYMGKRDSLWLLLFRLDSLNDALVAWDYMNAVVRNDFRILRGYREAYQERLRLSSELDMKQKRLQSVISDRLRQRERLVALQEQLDRKLAELTESERKRQTARIEQLTSEWETEGLPLFENYLSELGKAMNGISEILTDESKLSLNGTDIYIKLGEDDFNAFLKSKNKLFEGIEFRFDDNKMIISGSHDSKAISIVGKYVLEEQPKNLLRFQILSLQYNGYTLPDTTRKALDKQVDMTFEPGLLFAGLKASELQMKDGLLEVKLKFEGFPLALGRG